jgi:interleukin-1 receptor-associated kinase 4
MVEGNLEDNLACKKRSTPINWKNRIQIALGTAEGLEYLHRSAKVHRDVKSANILLGPSLDPKLADFGLMQKERSESEEEDTESQLVIAGTSCYMSPEAIAYGKITTMCDVFSYGVILLELLTSLPPDDQNRSNG